LSGKTFGVTVPSASIVPQSTRSTNGATRTSEPSVRSSTNQYPFLSK
jgi:hypothetical protein